MYKVYFNDKVIKFTKSTEHLDQNGYIVDPGERIDVTKVLQKVENSKNITLHSRDVEQLFAEFCSFFCVAQAAGGLVRDCDGRALMIYRNGRWDLPKGHREKGESIETCALREVTEECGTSRLEIGDLICQTMHIYSLDEQWILKDCYWYSMRCEAAQELKPQKEEGIECAQWMDQWQVEEALGNSYKTIIDVFKQEKTKI